jgi:hypothetical protein
MCHIFPTGFSSCFVDTYHHCMALSRAADGGDGLLLWRVAANILNKQSRTAENWWSSSFRVGRGINNYSTKGKLVVTKRYTGRRNWMDSLECPR